MFVSVYQFRETIWILMSWICTLVLHQYESYKPLMLNVQLIRYFCLCIFYYYLKA
jgi:hypothetical protein